MRDDPHEECVLSRIQTAVKPFDPSVQAFAKGRVIKQRALLRIVLEIMKGQAGRVFVPYIVTIHGFAVDVQIIPQHEFAELISNDFAKFTGRGEVEPIPGPCHLAQLVSSKLNSDLTVVSETENGIKRKMGCHATRPP